MAAGRAAELTEAYRVLSNESQRAPIRSRPRRGASFSTAARPLFIRAIEFAVAVAASRAAASQPIYQERASRDQFVRKATLEKIRQALALTGADYDETQVRGFDIALVPKPKLFGGGKTAAGARTVRRAGGRRRRGRLVVAGRQIDLVAGGRDLRPSARFLGGAAARACGRDRGAAPQEPDREADDYPHRRADLGRACPGRCAGMCKESADAAQERELVAVSARFDKRSQWRSSKPSICGRPT